MSAKKVSFQNALEALADEEQPFPKHSSYLFSDLEPEQLKELLEGWPRLTLSRKKELLEGLEKLIEDDTLLSFEALAVALLSDPDAPVRLSAIRLLDECEEIKLIRPFLDILSKDDDLDVRAAAATALGMFVQMGELDEIPKENRSEIEDTLLKVARGADQPLVQRRALESMGFSSRAEVVGLVEAAYGYENPEWTACALSAMGRSSDEHWQEHILPMLLSENKVVRMAAVQAAGELELSAAQGMLLRMLEEEDDPDIFNAIVWSLSQIGGEDVRTYLIDLLDQSEDSEQTEFLEDALANLSFTDDLSKFDLLTFDVDDEPEE